MTVFDSVLCAISIVFLVPQYMTNNKLTAADAAH